MVICVEATGSRQVEENENAPKRPDHLKDEERYVMISTRKLFADSLPLADAPMRKGAKRPCKIIPSADSLALADAASGYCYEKQPGPTTPP